MSQIKINVTQDDILNGTRANAQNCAIARAIQRELDRRDRSGITVTNAHIYVDGKLYKLPKKSAQFIYRFDRHQKAKPFSFMLREQKQQSQGYNYTLPSYDWSKSVDMAYTIISKV